MPGRAACSCPRRRDRPLGVVAQREARDAEKRRLLLDAARVGEHAGGAFDQAEELEVAERLESAGTPVRRPVAVRAHPPRGCAGGPGTRPASSAATRRGARARRRAAARRRAPGGAASPPGSDPGSSRAAPARRAASIRSRIATSVSIIVLPTAWIGPRRRPRASRFSARLGRVDEQQVRDLIGRRSG